MIKPVRVRDVMSRDVFTLAPDMEVVEAMRLLLDRHYSGAPVLDENGILVGVLSKKDCLRAALSAHYHHVWGGNVSDYMIEPVETLEADTDLTTVARVFVNSRYRRFPVMHDGQLVGQISRSDVLEALCRQWGKA